MKICREPKENGLKRIVVQDREDADLGYEGSHMYKRNGKYYIFTCHMGKGKKKTEDCFVSDSLTGEFIGGCVIDDDCGYHGLGVAQGGMMIRRMEIGMHLCFRIEVR